MSSLISSSNEKYTIYTANHHNKLKQTVTPSCSTKSTLWLLPIFVVVIAQRLSHLWVFETPWTVAHQCSLSITISLNLLKLMSIVEKAMAPHSSTLAWKIPLTEEPGRLQTMGSLRVRQDWMTSLSLFTFMHRRRNWQPTPVFLPGESQGQRSPGGCHLWGRTELDTTEATQQQQHVYWVSDATQPSHPLLPPSPLALNFSQHQGLFQWVSSSHQSITHLRCLLLLPELQL